MSGDPEMSQLLDKSFYSEEELKIELKRLRATLAEAPGRTVVDQSTGMIIDKYVLLNSEGKGAGTVELVWAEEERYAKLVESTGRTVGSAHEREGMRLF